MPVDLDALIRAVMAQEQTTGPPDPGVQPHGMGSGYPDPNAVQASWSVASDQPALPVMQASPMAPQTAPQLPNGPQGFGEQFGQALSKLDIPVNNFGSGAIAGFAQGFGGAQVAKISKREQINADLEKQAALQDQRNFLMTMQDRKNPPGSVMAGALEKAKAKQAGALAYPMPSRAKATAPKFDWATATPAERQTHLDEVKAEHQAMASGTTAAAPEEAPLDEGTLKTLAQIRIAGGPDPSFGMGKAGVANKTKYYQMLSKLGGSGSDIVTNSAGAKADRESLAALQKMYDSSTAFESTALKNSKVLLDTMQKIPDAGAPWINTPLRSVNKNLLGSNELAAYNTALQTVKPEFARILSSPTMAGQLTDAARKEMDKAMGDNATVGQIVAAVNILTQDAHNRTTSYSDQLKEIRARLKARTPGASLNGAIAPAAPATVPQTQYDFVNGHFVPRKP